MKAVVYTRYGSPDVLHIEEIDKPVPKANEILVKVHATTVNRTDNATTKAIPFAARIVTGLFRPKHPTPGSEFAGEVEAIGRDVTTLKVGERVFGFCDQGARAQAQYLVIRADHAVTIPEGISYTQAAASSEGVHYGYNFINKIKTQPGQYALVYGASGTIGSALVQLFNYFDVKVTAVCGARNIDKLKVLGANKVFDYTQEDFTRDTLRYHHIVDAVGKISFFKVRHLLVKGGYYGSTDLGFLGQNIFLPLITPLLGPLIQYKRTIFPFPVDVPASLALVRRMLVEGKFTPLIDREYPLEQIVDAYRYVEKGHKSGNVVISVGH